MTLSLTTNSAPGIRGLLQSLIKLYQRFLSPVLASLGSSCRFYPSCSHYAHDCLSKYPLSLAAPKVLGRLARCQPWHPGGIDLP